MRTMRLIVLPVILAFTFSCATMGLQPKVQNLRVGMTKKEAVNIMGRNYEIVHSMLSPQGESMEIIEYSDIYSVKYELEFVNDLLVRFTKVQVPPENNHNHQHKHSRLNAPKDIQQQTDIHSHIHRFHTNLHNMHTDSSVDTHQMHMYIHQQHVELHNLMNQGN